MKDLGLKKQSFLQSPAERQQQMLYTKLRNDAKKQLHDDNSSEVCVEIHSVLSLTVRMYLATISQLLLSSPRESQQGPMSRVRVQGSGFRVQGQGS